jgi:hypothetical protein
MAALWPTIMEPGTDPASHTEPLRSMKNILELITGQRPGAPYTVPRVFNTSIQPGSLNSPLKVNQLLDGDLWIDRGNNNKLKFWDKATQVWIPTT